jgi:hypothetical protein
VPCTVSATVPDDAFAGTTNDTCADALALIDREQEGEQVTPDGNPPTATATDPVNPFNPVTETVTGALVVPAAVVTDEGETEIEKSAAAVTVRLSGVLWLRFPIVPWTVSAIVPGDEFAATTNDTCAEALALIDREQEGEQVTPDGNPPTATATAPVNPFEPATEIVIGALVDPACTLMDGDEIEMEKSGVGGVAVAAAPLPPLHPDKKVKAKSPQTKKPRQT